MRASLCDVSRKHAAITCEERIESHERDRSYDPVVLDPLYELADVVLHVEHEGGHQEDSHEGQHCHHPQDIGGGLAERHLNVVLSEPIVVSHSTVLMHSLMCGPRLPHVPVLGNALSERCRSGASNVAQDRICL